MTIIKATNPASDTTTSFDYTASGASAVPTTFSLTGGTNQIITTAALSTTPQALTVTETAKAGWTPSISCVDSAGNPNPSFITIGEGTLTANLSNTHASATCTFTNTKSAAVTVTKTVTGATAGYVAGSTFPITVDCGTGHSQTFNLADGASATLNDVPAGASCGVSEGTLPDPMANYVYGTPTITPATFTAVAGQTQTVSVTNPLTRQTGAISVTKTLTGATAGYVAGSTFPITVNCGADGSTTFNLIAGGSDSVASAPAGASCTVSEGALPAPAANYVYGTPIISPSSFTVPAGQTQSVTVQNPLTRQTGTLVLTKVIAGPADGTALVTGDFTFSVTCDAGGPYSRTIAVTGGATNNASITDVPAGASCTVSETAKTTAPAGYVWTAGTPTYSPTNATITIVPNQSVAVTTTNTLELAPAGSLTVNKAITGGPASGDFKMSVTCTGNGVPNYGPTEKTITGAGSTTFDGIQGPTTCTVTETVRADAPANYEWTTPTPPAAITGIAIIAGGSASATVTNALRRLSSTLTLVKNVTVTGGPATAADGKVIGFSIDCGSDNAGGVPYTASVTITNGTGSTSLTTIPGGATCTISETTPLPAVTNYTWTTVAAQQTPTTASATTTTATFANTLTRQTSLINVTKTVTGGPAGVSFGTFNFTATCGADGNAGTSITLSGGAASGSANITVPAGASCTVTEGTLPTAPTNYSWGATPAPVPVTTNATTPVDASFTNVLTRQSSTLVVTKTVTGGPAGTSFGPFSFTATCDAGGPYTGTITVPATATAGAATSATLNLTIPAGAACTVTESSQLLPAAPAFYAWGNLPPAVPLTTTQAGPNAAAFLNTLTRLTTVITLAKSISGGPASGVSGTFGFTANCGADGSFTNTVTFNEAVIGNTTFTVPAGASCTVTETTPLPVAPASFAWGAPPTSTLAVGTESMTMSFVNTLREVPTTPVPTLSPLSLLLLGLVTALVGGVGLRRRGRK